MQSIFKKLLVILNVAGVDPGVVGYDLGGIEGFALEQFNSNLDAVCSHSAAVLRNRTGDTAILNSFEAVRRAVNACDNDAGVSASLRCLRLLPCRRSHKR